MTPPSAILPPMRIFLTALVGAALLLCGCATRSSCCPPPTCRSFCPPMPPTPAADATHVLYDGRLGTPTCLDDFVAEALGTDLVVFGELHEHPVGAEYELALLEKLGQGARPVALAMEFFEADTQQDLDAYLAGEIDEKTFRERTKRNPAYETTHGPLIEWAKAHGAPVIAANAPRKLVSTYRKTDLDYPGFLASLTPEERSWLPETTSVVEGPYWEHFAGLMGGDRARPFFRSQCLWDDAMAEHMAKFRDTHPRHRILFVVGAFHVTDGLGTITKFEQRRPDDKVSALIMTMNGDGSLDWDPDDHHAGNVVLKVKPPERRAPTGPNPHARPKKQPKAEPTTPEPGETPAAPRS